MTDLDEESTRHLRSRATPPAAATVRAARLAVAHAALGRWPGGEVRGLAVDDAATLLEMLGLDGEAA